MARIPGASQFLNTATLANRRGLPPSINTLLSNSSNSLLDAGRRINRGGVGLSAEARARNKQRLENFAAEGNAMFSLTIGQTNSVEGALTAIAALRSKTPNSQLARSLQVDDGGVTPSTTGQRVDEDA